MKRKRRLWLIPLAILAVISGVAITVWSRSDTEPRLDTRCPNVVIGVDLIDIEPRTVKAVGNANANELTLFTHKMTLDGRNTVRLSVEAKPGVHLVALAVAKEGSALRVIGYHPSRPYIMPLDATEVRYFAHDENARPEMAVGTSERSLFSSCQTI